jgi:hypothetical protein
MYDSAQNYDATKNMRVLHLSSGVLLSCLEILSSAASLLMGKDSLTLQAIFGIIRRLFIIQDY